MRRMRYRIPQNSTLLVPNPGTEHVNVGLTVVFAHLELPRLKTRRSSVIAGHIKAYRLVGVSRPDDAMSLSGIMM